MSVKLYIVKQTFINLINVKDKDNNIFKVNIDDPRYLSGELIKNINYEINNFTFDKFYLNF